jgi:cell division septation protein DedD
VEGLSTRLSLLEGLLKGLLPDADVRSLEDMRLVGRELGISLPVEDGDLDAPHGNLSSLSSRGTAVGVNSANGRTMQVHDDERLLMDLQGQKQYIGPSSSFLFHVKLRALFGGTVPQKYNQLRMSGRNAAEVELDITGVLASTGTFQQSGSIEWDMNSSSGSTSSLEEGLAPSIDAATLDCLVDAFFSRIHPDLPIFYESDFRTMYSRWRSAPSSVDKTWLCGLLCVFILARRAVSITVPPRQEDIWWKQVQGLLPTVLFSSSLPAIQSLLLASLHLHNIYHRDACWTLTGSAIRIAFAIGLHRDGVKHEASPEIRELRKQLWWTLYAFEQMQVSSHDRPSAIEDSSFSVSSPDESILGLDKVFPPEYSSASNTLATLLGRACRVIRTTASLEPNSDDAIGPLSPTARLLRDLERWLSSLPTHLSADNINALQPAFQRPVILLHCQYHYAVSLLTRSALLHRAAASSERSKSKLSTDQHRYSPAHLSKSIDLLSSSCMTSGRALSSFLLRLARLDCFNSITWWDIYYLFSSALILVLDIICSVGDGRMDNAKVVRDMSEELVSIAKERAQDQRMPGTLRNWSEVAWEVNGMLDGFLSGQAKDFSFDFGAVKNGTNNTKAREWPDVQNVIVNMMNSSTSTNNIPAKIKQKDMTNTSHHHPTNEAINDADGDADTDAETDDGEKNEYEHPSQRGLQGHVTSNQHRQTINQLPNTHTPNHQQHAHISNPQVPILPQIPFTATSSNLPYMHQQPISYCDTVVNGIPPPPPTVTAPAIPQQLYESEPGRWSVLGFTDAGGGGVGALTQEMWTWDEAGNMILGGGQ